jgi:hypothetical protein
MKAQILRHNGDPEVDSEVRFVRRHSNQFGSGSAFAAYIERNCAHLRAVYSGETGRVSIYARNDKKPLGVEPDPLAVWEERPQWSVEPGRLLYLNGELVCVLQNSRSVGRSPADVDGLAVKIVELLNKEGVEL